MAYYAWTEIKAGDKSAKAGDTVTAEKLGIDKEEFDAMVESGAVREEKFPDLPEGYTGSPSDYYKEQAAGVLEGTTSAAEVSAQQEKAKENK